MLIRDITPAGTPKPALPQPIRLVATHPDNDTITAEITVSFMANASLYLGSVIVKGDHWHFVYSGNVLPPPVTVIEESLHAFLEAFTSEAEAFAAEAFKLKGYVVLH
jgi:hypothetical protein